jgi:Reverse transcriptase (RNA-dependent DNA polymerase)
MEAILKGLPWDTCLVYIDDIIIPATTFDQGVSKIEEVLKRLRLAKLKLNPKKCDLFKQSVKFFGHIVSEKGVETDPEKTKAVLEWPLPKFKIELQSFLGLC